MYEKMWLTKPRKIDLYNVFCALLYFLKSGYQLRMLPQDFPKWRSVHAYFQIWTEKNGDARILEKILQNFGKIIKKRLQILTKMTLKF